MLKVTDHSQIGRKHIHSLQILYYRWTGTSRRVPAHNRMFKPHDPCAAYDDAEMVLHAKPYDQVDAFEYIQRGIGMFQMEYGGKVERPEATSSDNEEQHAVKV